ncbi:hypothetical protein, partial [uncultured Desulfovibrio sp.]
NARRQAFACRKRAFQVLNDRGADYLALGEVPDCRIRLPPGQVAADRRLPGVRTAQQKLGNNI